MRELRNGQGKSIAWAKEVGITQMITATLGEGNGGNSPTLDQVKRAADEYNRIAAVAARAGIQQGLHNEGFELPMFDGKRTYDLLSDLLDPELVKFQFQMSTITAGLVAAEYFLKYPGRFNSMHLQDVDMNAPVPAPPPKGAPAGRRVGRRPQVARHACLMRLGSYGRPAAARRATARRAGRRAPAPGRSIAPRT